MMDTPFEIFLAHLMRGLRMASLIMWTLYFRNYMRAWVAQRKHTPNFLAVKLELGEHTLFIVSIGVIIGQVRALLGFIPRQYDLLSLAAVTLVTIAPMYYMWSNRGRHTQHVGAKRYLTMFAIILLICISTGFILPADEASVL